jgi:hypothetical protein
MATPSAENKTTSTVDNKTTSTPAKAEAKASKKITDEEKKELVDLYEKHYKLDDKSLPTFAEDAKSKDILLKILATLKEQHKIFKFFNTNKLLVIAKSIQDKQFPKKKGAKKPETRESIMKKIEQLKKKLTAIDSGVVEALADEDDIKEEDL